MARSVFISGPMTNIPRLNRPAFFEAERILADHGYIAWNPAHHPDGLKHEQYMHVCKAMLDVCDTIVQLPGWQDSKGATEEHQYALQRGMRIVEWR